ncbi:MAG: flagellar export protein FliJ [Steroidobacteraceae bacterium]|jgi:flagellar FliJ protein
MVRAQRLKPVHQAAEDAERRSAARVVSAQSRLTEAEGRCRDLEQYLGEYQNTFRAKASAGLDARALRAYQIFIAKLTEAITTQRGLIAQLLVETEREQQQWREAATRTKAVGKVIEQATAEASKLEERKVQRETDEHAQRQRGIQ